MKNAIAVGIAMLALVGCGQAPQAAQSNGGMDAIEQGGAPMAAKKETDAKVAQGKKGKRSTLQEEMEQDIRANGFTKKGDAFFGQLSGSELGHGHSK